MGWGERTDQSQENKERPRDEKGLTMGWRLAGRLQSPVRLEKAMRLSRVL